MKRVVAYCAIVLILVLQGHAVYARNAITYQMNSSGRFGEHSTSYIKGLYLAKKYDLDFLYKPYVYTNDLLLDTGHSVYQEAVIKQNYKRTIQVYNEDTIRSDVSTAVNTLYVVQWGTTMQDFASITDIQDEELVSRIKKAFSFADVSRMPAPLSPDLYHVALHVRRGGGFDAAWVLKHQHLRFPKDDYYLTQLRRIAEMMPNATFEVHIFTDDPRPKLLAMQYTAILKNPRIRFVYREFGNKHDANVLEDLMAMAQCDALIRPGSCLSELAQLIGNHKIIIYPVSYCLRGKQYVLDRFAVVTRDSNNKLVYSFVTK